MIAVLFEVEINTLNDDIKEIFKSVELQESATIRNFRMVQTEDKREVAGDVEFYNLQIVLWDIPKDILFWREKIGFSLT